MKILLHSYATCCQNTSGGIQSRVRAFYKQLKQRGHEVSFFSTFDTKIQDYDAVHFFRADNEYINLIHCCKQKGVRVIISTVIPLKNRTWLVVNRFLSKFPLGNIYKVAQKCLDMADVLIAETYQERDFIVKYYGININKIKVIPNGIEPIEYDGNEIYEAIGYKGDYVLCVGRFDKNKNQLNLINALKGAGIHVVFIGGGDQIDKSAYFERCKEVAGTDRFFHFLGWVDNRSSILKSAYVNAKVFVLPSFRETFGMVAIEAASAGANIVLSRSLPIRDFPSFKGCPSFDPNNPHEMHDSILAAFNEGKSGELKKRVLEEFSWDRIVEEHINCYKSE